MVAQLTTDNVNLLTSVAEAPYQFQLSTFVGWLGMEAYKFIYYTNLENPYNMNLYLLYGILVVALLYVLTLKLIEYKNGESLFLRRFPAFSMLISQVTIVATLFSCMPKGLVGGGEKNDPPFWLAASFVNGGGLTNETPSVTDPPGTFSPAHYSGLPVSGMYFIHPDHLGSTSMLADGLGRMVAGVDINSGKSYVSYKPYGEVNRTNSSGPDIFRYKFNKQESDSETGLYYYGARYYDPFIGRFTQADSLIDTEDIMGFNQYMYTNGNPVNYTDPTGHNAYMHMFGSIIKNMVGGLKWMSKGLQRAADTVSRFTYGVHHHKNSLVDKIARSDRGVIQGKINKWLDVKVIDPMMHMNLRDILITIAVAAAIFALGVLIGPAIAGAAAYVAGGLTAGFGIGWLTTGVGFMIEGVLGYYAGNFLVTFGRELGRLLGALSSSSLNHLAMDSENARRGAELGSNAADVANNLAQFQGDFMTDPDLKIADPKGFVYDPASAKTLARDLSSWELSSPSSWKLYNYVDKFSAKDWAEVLSKNVIGGVESHNMKIHRFWN